jgi:hypothetical protein
LKQSWFGYFNEGELFLQALIKKPRDLDYYLTQNLTDPGDPVGFV